MTAAVKHLRERAESYASDAAKFRDAATLGKPILDEPGDRRWATVYQIIADELRQCAAETADADRKSCSCGEAFADEPGHDAEQSATV